MNISLADQIAYVDLAHSIVRGKHRDITSYTPYDGFAVEALEKTMAGLQAVLETLRGLEEEEPTV
jgi:hypothetical protein